MPIGCRLVYLPGLPFTTATLCPQLRLATLAAALHACGHRVEVLDFGTLESLDRAAGRLKLGAPGGAAPWQRLWGAGPSRGARELGEALEARRAEAARAALRGGAPDLVVFVAERAADWVEAQAAARLLRAWSPGVRLLASGAHAGQDAAGAFDAVLIGDPEPGIVQAAEHVRAPSAWESLPNLALPGRRCDLRRAEVVGQAGAMAEPLYESGVYTAAGKSDKLHVWTFEHSRGESHVPWSFPQAPLGLRHVRTRNASDLCDAMARRVRAGAGAGRVFFFEGAATPEAQMAGLAFELLARGLRVRYGREAHVRHVDRDHLPTLAASGLEAAGFRVDSGSQRLLDDFYGHAFGVSEAEAALKACREAGTFVSASWTYPCPRDDRHTREETVRLLSRARPHAAVFEAARALPQSLWALRREAFGFRDGRGAGTGMAGWRAGRVAAEQAWLRGRLGDLGIAEGVGAREALIARVAGYAGREAEFVHGLDAALAAFDTVRAAAYLTAFNAAAARPAAPLQLEPFHALAAAVGN